MLICFVIKKLNPVVTELIIKGRKVNISLAFITKSNLGGPQSVRITSTHILIINISNKRQLQHTAFNHSSDIDFKDFMNLYRKCVAKPVIDTTLAFR